MIRFVLSLLLFVAGLFLMIRYGWLTPALAMGMVCAFSVGYWQRDAFAVFRRGGGT